MFKRQIKKKQFGLAIYRSVIDTLESRQLLSAAVLNPLAHPLTTAVPLTGTLADGQSTPTGLGYAPADLLSAYGINNIKLNGVTGNGAGQTIAIVVADDDPGLVNSTNASFSTSDLAIFDKQFGLPSPPSFTKIEQDVDGSYPPADTAWAEESDLDVEYIHAIAPDASIDLIEAQSASATQLFGYGAQTAAAEPGVSVVLMSFAFDEFSGETSYDGNFATPSGHQGVTFVAGSGDTGQPGSYPAFSPNVVAVGATELTATNGTYNSEIWYPNSGGGISNYESEPAYQDSVQGDFSRTSPDVAFDGDPDTGVPVYDSYNGGYGNKWYEIGGTSLASPAWAALIGIANQGRAQAGLGTLDGISQTLPKLYSISASDYHDVKSSTSSDASGTGYDLVTGRGSPIANLLVPDLAGVPSTAATGSIAGTVNKVVSGSTSGFSGVTISLTNNSTVSKSTTTSSSGTYSFTGLAAGTYYVSESVPSGYTQTAPGSSSTTVTLTAGQNSAGENFTDTAVVTTTGTKLTGTVIGTSGSYQNDGNTIAKAFDGSLTTYFDGPTANGNWAGLNLGAEDTVTSIEYSPRPSWATRMVGGTFQGSNSSTFASGVTNLATITSTPAIGSFTTVSVTSSSAFLYVRYLSPSGSYGDVAEVEFFGKAGTSTGPTPLTGTVIGTSGSYENDGNTIANAFDGNLSTFFDGPTANGNWAGLEFSTAQTITQISYAPRANWASRMVGGTFQASNSSTFSSGVVNLYTITSTPAYNTLTTVAVNVSGSYLYVRYLSPSGSYGDVAEIDFYG